MAATTEQGGVTPWETAPIMSPEQMSQIITSLSGGTKKPKANEP